MTYQEALAWVESLPQEIAMDLGGPYDAPRIALARAIQQLVIEERQAVIDEVWHSVAPASTYAKFSTGELRSEVANTRKVLEKISEQEGIKR